MSSASSLAPSPTLLCSASETRGAAVLLTGLPASGKSSLAESLRVQLSGAGRRAHVVDGDALRALFASDLGFSAADRARNLERAALLAREVMEAGDVALCAFVAPQLAARLRMRAALETAGQFFLVYVATPLTECEQRDPKGLYRRARAGEVALFTGVSDAYEPPARADVVIDTTGLRSADAATRVLTQLVALGLNANAPKAAVAGGGVERANEGPPQPAGAAAATTVAARAGIALLRRQERLPDLARRLAVERHALEAALRAQETSFRELRRRAILARATALLAEGAPVKVVAYELGFSSHRSFDRFIRAACGRSPSQLRAARTEAQTTPKL